jgi:two-component system alkaline phosphatase synthesis response regulator PhoP
MSKPKILVVDDDIDYVESTAAILEANGYEVIAAYDGKEGLEKAKSELPQLILIDLMMNTINEGYDLVRDIRSEERFDEVPLIMISSAHQHSMFKDANFVPDEVWFPIDKFLDKPIDKGTLLKNVSQMIKKKC